MPSGRTHDAITILVAGPVLVASYLYTQRLSTAIAITAAFIFGGLMFGPDLDTGSKQYSRWGLVRFIWLPYRALFRHRSRFSHGLILGSLIRVTYLHAAVAVLGFAVVYAWALWDGGRPPELHELTSVSAKMGSSAIDLLGENGLILGFIGVWLGAASHTFTDMAGSFVKTGRVTEFL